MNPAWGAVGRKKLYQKFKRKGEGNMKKKVLGIILAGCMCAGLTLTAGVGVENVQAADKKLVYISRDMTDPFWCMACKQYAGNR